MSIKYKKCQLTLNLEVINLLVHRVDILLLSELMFAFSNHYFLLLSALRFFLPIIKFVVS